MQWSKLVENSLASKSSSTTLSPFREITFPSILKPTSSAETDIKLPVVEGKRAVRFVPEALIQTQRLGEFGAVLHRAHGQVVLVGIEFVKKIGVCQTHVRRRAEIKDLILWVRLQHAKKQPVHLFPGDKGKVGFDGEKTVAIRKVVDGFVHRSDPSVFSIVSLHSAYQGNREDTNQNLSAWLCVRYTGKACGTHRSIPSVSQYDPRLNSG